MPITLITGNAGSGKSLYAVAYFMLPEASKLDRTKYPPTDSRRIIHNIEGINPNLVNWHVKTGVSLSDLSKGMVSYPSNVDIWDFELRKGLKEGDEPLFVFRYLRFNDFLVFDECQGMFSKTGFDYKSERYQKFLMYLTHHRKFGHDILFITQDSANIANLILGLVDMTYALNKAIFRGATKSFTYRIYRGGTEQQSYFVDRFTKPYRSDCFCLYSSYKGPEALEKTRSVNYFTTRKMLILYTLIAMGVLFFAFNTYKMSNDPTLFGSSKPKPAIIQNEQNQQNEDNASPINNLAPVEVKSFVLQGDLCQIETQNTLSLVPAFVCDHMPIMYLGRLYRLAKKTENPANGARYLF